MLTELRAWAIAGVVVLAAGIVAAWGLGCKTPEILIDHTPDPYHCGEYPVQCGPASPVPCVPEGYVCTVHGAELELPEWAGVHLDAGASE